MNHISTRTGTTTAALLCVAILLEAARRRYKERESKRNKRRTTHPVALSIEQHLLHSQPPARRLGIRVDDYAPNQHLSLSAPLHPHNINVHGTAFAGSLYSVAVLASYYLGRQWLLDQGILTTANDTYQLVARGGSIRYRRPVTSPRCVATSTITASPPSTIRNELQHPPFHYNWTIDGVMTASSDDATACCTYSIQLCIYDPVAKQRLKEQQVAAKEMSSSTPVEPAVQKG